MFMLRRHCALSWRAALAQRLCLRISWLSVVMALATTGACSRQRVQQSDASEALATLDLGTVEVGSSVHAKTALPVGRVAVLFELSEAPPDIDAPSRLFSRPGEPAWLALRWRPRLAGSLDDQVIYRMSVGPTETTFRVQLRGEAWSGERAPEPEPDAEAEAAIAVTPCTTAADCADDEPCTHDTCEAALGCRNAPANEGRPCGPFDCTLGHFCATGRCAAVDMREVSDGMACDDADPCSLDGECRAGLCYASTEPRAPKVLDTLPSFGDGMSDVAHAAGTYVFAGLDRLDVVTETGSVLQHRARVPLRGASFVESAGPRRFLVRTAEGQVLRLDTQDPAAPKLTSLPHIVPMPVTSAESGRTRAAFEAKWAVSGEWVVIATSSWKPDATSSNDNYYAATLAPIAPGAARALDVPSYRMAAADGLVAWAQPGIGGHGDEVLGVLRLQDGVVLADTRIKRATLQASGCTQPKFLAVSRAWVATLSNSDMSGTSTLCLWRVGAGAESLTFAALHTLYDRPQDPAIAMDDEALYLSANTWWSPGFGGELMGKGQLKRFPLTQLLASSDALSFQGSPQIGPFSGELLKLSGQRLLVIGDAISVLRLDGAPLSGPGFGQINGALAFESGRRALLGGRTSFALLEVAQGPPKLVVSDWQQHYPKAGDLNGDLRILRAEGKAKNLTPVSLSPKVKIESLEQLTARPGADGALQVDTQSRALTLGYGWISSALTDGAYTLHAAGSLLVFGDADTSLPSRTLSVPNWQRGSESYPDVFLRETSSGNALSILQSDRLTLADAVATSADAGLPTQTLPPALEPSTASPYPWFPSGFAVDGDHVLRAEGRMLVLHSRQGRFAPTRLALAEDAKSPVLIPAFGPGWALVSYQDAAGQSWLVQVTVQDGALHAFSRLPVAGYIASADRVGEHWIVGTSSGVQLVDLACWPGDER